MTTETMWITDAQAGALDGPNASEADNARRAILRAAKALARATGGGVEVMHPDGFMLAAVRAEDAS